jgi:hypothetical protein
MQSRPSLTNYQIILNYTFPIQIINDLNYQLHDITNDPIHIHLQVNIQL